MKSMLKGLSGMRLYFSCCLFEASQVTPLESSLESIDMHMSTTAWNVWVHIVIIICICMFLIWKFILKACAFDASNIAPHP